jgi:hypothetical protein
MSRPVPVLSLDVGKQSRARKIGPQHIRVLGYVACACVFAAAIYTRMLGPSEFFVIVLAALPPWGQQRLRGWLDDHYSDSATGIILLTDGVATGFGIAAIHYSLVPSLVFLGILNASAMAYGEVILWGLAAITAFISSLLGGRIFGMQPRPFSETPPAGAAA